MASFCKQCSEELFGYDAEDFVSEKLTKEMFEAGEIFLSICEGCGFIETNHLGECVSHDCEKHGKDNIIKFPLITIEPFDVSESGI